MASKELRRRVGTRIRSAREANGLSQRELADLIPGPVESNTISRWERGQHMPEWPYLEAIAEALEVTIAWLLSTNNE